MSNIPMNNLNIQRRVLNFMHNQPMPMLSNQYSVPLPPNQNQERNPESKINLAFGLLRKNTARTNGIWKIIQSLIERIKKIEESTAMIDQVIKRNEELEDKRRKGNKKRNEKKRIKREKRKEDKKRLKGNEEQKKKEGEKEEINIVNEDKIGSEFMDEERVPKITKNLSSRNSKQDLEISRIKDDSRNMEKDSIKNLEISRTNLINKKINNNKKKININNNDEISFKGLIGSNVDECSLQLKDKINRSNDKLSKNGRNKQNVINLVNRFILNNKNIYNSNHKWVSQTFIPLVEDVIDLDLYDIDLSDYIRKIQSPPEFRKKFWLWWKMKDTRKRNMEILNTIQKLKQSNDPDIRKFVYPQNPQEAK